MKLSFPDAFISFTEPDTIITHIHFNFRWIAFKFISTSQLPISVRQSFFEDY